jgi:hypothetical protein
VAKDSDSTGGDGTGSGAVSPGLQPGQPLTHLPISGGSGAGPFFAVTSLARQSWFIVADGESPAALRDRAIALIAGSAINQPADSIPLSEIPIRRQVENLVILTRSHACALVGYAGLRRYLTGTLSGADTG